MSTIIISAHSYCNREEVASRVAQELQFECIGGEVLAEASRSYSVPEVKLREALENTSFLLGRSPNTRSSRFLAYFQATFRYLAYFQAALTAVLKRDNVVYHGWAGHLFIEGVSHILKVRLVQDFEERVRLKTEKENISEKKAREALTAEAEKRKKWSKATFGVDETDLSLFDLVVDVNKHDSSGSVHIICQSARDIRFQPVIYSIKAMEDIELASRVRATLIDSYPDIRVQARDGNVSINTKGLKKEKRDKILSMCEHIESIEGVGHVEVA